MASVVPVVTVTVGGRGTCSYTGCLAALVEELSEVAYHVAGEEGAALFSDLRSEWSGDCAGRDLSVDEAVEALSRVRELFDLFVARVSPLPVNGTWLDVSGFGGPVTGCGEVWLCGGCSRFVCSNLMLDTEYGIMF